MEIAQPDSEDWNIAALFGAGISFKGTRQEAEEEVNRLSAAVQMMLTERGIVYLRKQHIILRKGHDLDGSNADENGAGIL